MGRHGDGGTGEDGEMGRSGEMKDTSANSSSALLQRGEKELSFNCRPLTLSSSVLRLPSSDLPISDFCSPSH